MIEFQLEAAHPAHRAKIEALIRGLSARFPDVPLKAVLLYDPSPDDRSLAYADETGTIALNPFWFAQDPAVLSDAARENYLVSVGGKDLGWHGQMLNEPEHVITHEFGHVAVKAIPRWRQWAEKAWRAATHNPKLAPAGYAIASPEEYFAEAFAAHVLDLDGTEDEFQETEHPLDPGEQFTEKGIDGAPSGRSSEAPLRPAPPKGRRPRLA